MRLLIVIEMLSFLLILHSRFGNIGFVDIRQSGNKGRQDLVVSKSPLPKEFQIAQLQDGKKKREKRMSCGALQGA